MRDRGERGRVGVRGRVERGRVGVSERGEREGGMLSELLSA